MAGPPENEELLRRIKDLTDRLVVLEKPKGDAVESFILIKTGDKEAPRSRALEGLIISAPAWWLWYMEKAEPKVTIGAFSAQEHEPGPIAKAYRTACCRIFTTQLTNATDPYVVPPVDTWRKPTVQGPRTSA